MAVPQKMCEIMSIEILRGKEQKQQHQKKRKEKTKTTIEPTIGELSAKNKASECTKNGGFSFVPLFNVDEHVRIMPRPKKKIKGVGYVKKCVRKTLFCLRKRDATLVRRKKKRKEAEWRIVHTKRTAR